MKASFKYYLLLLFCVSRFSAFAQWPDKSHLPPDTLLQMWYIDSNQKIPIKGIVIDLKLKDRLVVNWQERSFEVMLKMRNTSRKTLIVPREIDCYDDSGFNSEGWGTERGQPLHPGSVATIPVTINNTLRTAMYKGGYLKIYVSGGDYVLYPIHLAVRYIEPDSMKTKH